MRAKRRARNSGTLCLLALVGGLYGTAALARPSFTNNPTLEGALSILLGLYICSHPAANAVDLLFFQRDALQEAASEPSGLAWLALNVLVLLTGWLVIFVGATRLVGQVP
jgi:hypothetical protein